MQPECQLVANVLGSSSSDDGRNRPMNQAKQDVVTNIVGALTGALGVRRLRVRRVDPDPRKIENVLSRAAREGKSYTSRHGGSVCNSYGYPADTEYYAVCAIRDGVTLRVRYGAGRMPANKCTHAGALGRVAGSAWATWSSLRYARRVRQSFAIDHPHLILRACVDDYGDEFFVEIAQ